MYAVVVADDEPLARKGLQTSVDWESLGCRLVGAAANGEQAVEMVVSHNADILITDVRMPGMDGHQVIQKARARKPDLLAVIVSGYDEFDYVRRALTIGVENYILKPIDREEMHSTIASAVSRLTRIRQSKRREALVRGSFRDSVMTRLVHGEIGQLELIERLSVLGLSLEGPRYRVLVFGEPTEPNERGGLSAREHYVPFVDYDGNVVVVACLPNEPVESRSPHELLVALDSVQGEMRTRSIGIGSLCTRLDEIPRSYREARVALFTATRLVSSQTRTVEFPAPDSVTDRRIDAFASVLDQSLLAGDADALRQYWNDLCCEPNLPVVDAGRVAGCALLEAYSRLDDDETALEGLRERARPVGLALIRPVPPADLAPRLGDLYERLLETLLESGRLHPSLAQRAAHFVRERFDRQISLKVLAGVFGVTPSYLGHVFREETGQSFSHYLNSIRMDRAKELLASSHQSAAQIARAVGYSDPNYFYKKFREMFNISPAEFRGGQ